jgi:hypothetical protein
MGMIRLAQSLQILRWNYRFVRRRRRQLDRIIRTATSSSSSSSSLPSPSFVLQQQQQPSHDLSITTTTTTTATTTQSTNDTTTINGVQNNDTNYSLDDDGTTVSDITKMNQTMEQWYEMESFRTEKCFSIVRIQIKRPLNLCSDGSEDSDASSLCVYHTFSTLLLAHTYTHS